MEPNVPARDPGLPPPAAAEAGPAPCWRCGTPPEDRYQEYCLECGARLARYSPRTSFFQREAWSRESPAWLWLTMLALLLLALVATAIVAAASTRDDRDRRPRAAAPEPTTSTINVMTGLTTAVVPPTTAFTTPTLPTPTLPTTTVPTTPVPGTTGTTTNPAAGRASWPAAKSGYTIVVASIPTRRGRSAADTRANAAASAGLAQVGVLNSSDYASLRPGYWVVFTGIHDTLAQAQSRLSAVRAAGYPLAYPREIRP